MVPHLLVPHLLWVVVSFLGAALAFRRGLRRVVLRERDRGLVGAVSAAWLGALMAQNLGRAGPIPPPTPAGRPWTALLLGALLWALVAAERFLKKEDSVPAGSLGAA